jgi:hypothetical protein
MKTKSIAALIILMAFSSALPNEFPEVGKRYSVDYAVSSESNLPRNFKIISKGTDSWYLVEFRSFSLGTLVPYDARMWINFAHILSAREVLEREDRGRD